MADADPRVDAPPGTDGGDPDGGRDGGADTCSPTPTCVDGCPLPWLLASVEALPPNDCPGQILRWSLESNDQSCVCAALRAEDTLEVPFAVGFVPPNLVVAVEQSGAAVAIDADTDTVRWREPGAGLPRDVFALRTPGGEPRVGVATLRTGGTDIIEVRALDTVDGRTTDTWRTNGTFPGGLGITSITMNPYDPRQVRALKATSFAAANIDPWTGSIATSPPQTAARSGYDLRTISALHWGSTYRVVWTGRNDSGNSRVFNQRSINVVDDQRVPLGDQCLRNADQLDYGATCEFVHAVPSPHHDMESFALCELSPVRRVVRLRHINDTCHDLLDDAAVFGRARISKLALALPDYWAGR
ncbi:MAG: hypothetical protein KF901_24860 [Myxococcales bacterium]|nr:hypothetical protein [Myxococcales bacterium]